MKVWVVFSWRDDNIEVEGVFARSEDADAVAFVKKRPITVCPCALNTVLSDRDDWPGSYYVYPDGRRVFCHLVKRGLT